MTAKEMFAEMGYKYSGEDEKEIWFEKRQRSGTVQSRVQYVKNTHVFHSYEDYGDGLVGCGAGARMVRAMAKLLDELEKPSGWVPFTEEYNNDF